MREQLSLLDTCGRRGTASDRAEQAAWLAELRRGGPARRRSRRRTGRAGVLHANTLGVLRRSLALSLADAVGDLATRSTGHHRRLPNWRVRAARPYVPLLLEDVFDDPRRPHWLRPCRPRSSPRRNTNTDCHRFHNCHYCDTRLVHYCDMSQANRLTRGPVKKLRLLGANSVRRRILVLAVQRGRRRVTSPQTDMSDTTWSASPYGKAVLAILRNMGVKATFGGSAAAPAAAERVPRRPAEGELQRQDAADAGLDR